MNGISSQTFASPADPPRPNHGFTLMELLVTMSVIAILVALFMPATRSGREPARRSQCKCHLKQIGLALYNYHDAHGVFPPAYTVDAEGNRLHSWRTLILPYMDQQPLYERIDLSKPWDDPANAEVFQANLYTYLCPSADCARNHTTYLAVVTPESVIQPEESRALSEITDGTTNTLMVIEVDAAQSVPWMSPMDAGEAQVIDFSPQTELPHEGGVTALFADGSVQFLSAEMPPSERQSLITISASDNSTR